MTDRDSIEVGLSALSGPLSAADVVALGRALLQAFDAEKGIGGAVKRAARSMRQTSEALRVAWEADVRGAIAASGARSVRGADVDEDAVWVALYRWLSGWASLPEGSAPERDSAREMLATLFPDGVTFVELTYALEWAEADRRVATIEGDGLAARIEALGGGVVLRVLRAAHAEYERVLGIGPMAAPDPAGDAIRPLKDDARREIVAYVRSVRDSSTGDVRDEAHRAALLAPLHGWSARLATRERRARGGVTARE